MQAWKQQQLIGCSGSSQTGLPDEHVPCAAGGGERHSAGDGPGGVRAVRFSPVALAHTRWGGEQYAMQPAGCMAGKTGAALNAYCSRRCMAVPSVLLACVLTAVTERRDSAPVGQRRRRRNSYSIGYGEHMLEVPKPGWAAHGSQREWGMQPFVNAVAASQCSWSM